MTNLPDYKILTASDAHDLQLLVVHHLAEGWELAGGVCHAVLDSKTAGPVRSGYESWSQAIVRYPTWQD
jgi:hypothetical protein